MIERRIFIAGLGALLAAPLAAEAQQAGKIPRIGVLDVRPDTLGGEALRQGLRELGYVEGQNTVIDWRWAEGRADRFSDFAAELVRLKADVIVASNNAAVQAAQRSTKTIPIVMVFPTDPVGLGFVSSLARPGGNITGLTGLGTELQRKRLQLLKETVPHASHVAILWDPGEPGRQAQAREWEAAARVVGLRSQRLEARTLSDIDNAFVAMTKEGVHAVLVGASTMIYEHRAKIAERATRSRLPTICLQAWYVEAGCLMSYGAHFPDLYRRAAEYVDRILKGAKPGDLPVEQPTRFELVINMKTAKALGLTIPPSLLRRADQVIE